MSRVLPVLLLALAASAAPAAAARRCTLPGAKTVLKNAGARVFSVAGKGSVERRYFGCRANRRPILLAIDRSPRASDETHTSNALFRLAGTWVAWRYTSTSDFGAGEFGTGLRVVSLAGARRAVTQDTSRQTVKNLVLAPDGAVAWVLVSGEFREIDGIAARTSGPTPLVVARGIASASLTLARGRVGYTLGGKRFSVALRPPPALPASNGVGPQGLDGRFGDCGTLVPAAPKRGSFTAATRLAPAPDGALVAAGTTSTGGTDPLEPDTFVVSRFSPEGAFDRGFGDGGVVQTVVPRPNGSQRAELTGTVVLPDGRVVIAGTATQGSSALSRGLVLRYRADGTLDDTFGSGGIADAPVAAGRSAEIRALALGPDGSLLVAGRRDDRSFVARLRPDGSLDKGFGTNGIATDPGKGPSEFNALSVAEDGTIFAAGGSGPGAPLLARFTRDGALLSVTSGAPPATVSLTALAPTAGGGVVAAGTAGNITSPNQVVLARYTADGDLDTGFDGDGFALDPQVSAPEDIVVEPDGHLLLSASFSFTPGRYAGSGLVRYSAGGARDPGFGIRGGLGGVSSAGLENGEVLLADPAGALAGTAFVAQDNGGGFAISRFALTAPATTATRKRSTVCAMATGSTIGPLVKQRRLDVSLRLRAPARLRLTVRIRARGRTLTAGRVTVFRPYVEGALATVRLSKAAVKLLRGAKTAKLTVVGGRPRGATTVYTARLTR